MKNNNLLVGGLILTGLYLWLRPVSKSTSGSLGATGLVSTLPLTEVVGTIRRVTKDLFNQINNASSLTGTPTWLITAIMAHEIRWRPYATARTDKPYATGAMQMTTPTMFDTYYHATKMNLVSPSLEQYIRSVMGNQFAGFVKLAKDRQSDRSYRKFLLNPEFAVVMGALMIRCLMQLFTKRGTLDLAKLVLGYNQGFTYVDLHMLSLPDVITPQEVMAKAPSGGKTYIQDLIGSGGYLEQIKVLNG